MKLNIKEILDFFDDIKDSQKGDANAVSTILGEDLNASSYKHFRKNGVKILDDSVLQGGRNGKKLDRWIIDKKNKLYQCEIKNWAATAIGGKQLGSDASDEMIKAVAKYHWNREEKNSFSKKTPHPNRVSKVLLPMRPPVEYKNLKIEPLLIYWMPISSDKRGLNPLSSISHLPFKTPFSKLHIFSVSLYLRFLIKNGEKYIDLDMPHFEHRIKILSKLQKIKIKF
ncbi:MAG: hypothetical protein AAB956_02095 [Patescibacteria group bacterium]